MAIWECGRVFMETGDHYEVRGGMGWLYLKSH